jgi:hypothetical protein
MTTQHTCGGPAFGRKTAGCPRCDELLRGAAPVQQAWRQPARRTQPTRSAAEQLRAHRSTCRACQTGGVCTAFDW